MNLPGRSAFEKAGEISVTASIANGCRDHKDRIAAKVWKCKDFLGGMR